MINAGNPTFLSITWLSVKPAGGLSDGMALDRLASTVRGVMAGLVLDKPGHDGLRP
jgi:hypothetical protein